MTENDNEFMGNDDKNTAETTETVEGNNNSVPDLSEDTEKWEDVVGSKQLFRKVLKSAAVDTKKPVIGDLVTVCLRGKLDDGKIVDCHEELQFIVGHSDVIQALDLCIPFMMVGEIDVIRTTARFAYGKAGKDDEIPPDANIEYEVELLKIEKGPDIYEMTIDQRIEFAETKKKRGNYYFSREEFTLAIEVYRRALKILEPELTETETAEDKRKLLQASGPIYNNLAAAQLKIGAYDAAIDSLRHCTLVEPKNVKALFRMGKAFMGKQDYGHAITIFEEAAKLDSENKAIVQEMERAKRLVKAERDASKNVYKRMFREISSDEEKESGLKSFLKKYGYVVGALATASVAIAVYRFGIRYDE